MGWEERILSRAEGRKQAASRILSSLENYQPWRGRGEGGEESCSCKHQHCLWARKQRLPVMHPEEAKLPETLPSHPGPQLQAFRQAAGLLSAGLVGSAGGL